MSSTEPKEEQPARFKVTGEVAGHKLEMEVTAANGTESAEKEAEKIFVDLRGRAEQLDVAVTNQDRLPEEVVPGMRVNWPEVLEGYNEQ